MSTHFSVIRAMQLDPSDTMGVDWLQADAAATRVTSIEQEEAPVNVYAESKEARKQDGREARKQDDRVRRHRLSVV